MILSAQAGQVVESSVPMAVFSFNAQHPPSALRL